MPVNDIIQQALDNNPLNLKKAFEDEMTVRVRAALNQKYNDMTQEHPEVAEVDTMAADLAAEPEAEAAVEAAPVEEPTEEQ
jgi:2-oxo-4-hydroxy-4-carboxy--5-ureidoimidazoline (OHCU) decarboxylase